MNTGLFYHYHGRALETFDAIDNVKRELAYCGEINPSSCSNAIFDLRQRLQTLWGAMPGAFDYWNKLDSIKDPGALAELLKRLEQDLEQFKDEHFYPEHGRMPISTEWYEVEEWEVLPPDPPRFF